MKEDSKLKMVPGKILNWKSFVPAVLRTVGQDFFKSNKSSIVNMKNKTFDPRIHESDAEFQKPPFKIISFSAKKRKKPLTIKDVFYESVNFRWDEIDNEIF